DDGAFRGGAFAELAELEERHWWFRARTELIGWALRTYFPAARSFFDAGCGTGSVLDALGRAAPALRRSGGELLAAGLESAARRLGSVPLCQVDATRLPFAEEFDVVGAFDVIEHIEDDEAALRSFRRALRPRGGLLLTVPQHAWLWTDADEFGGHRRRYARADLAAKLGRTGFEVVRMTSFVTLLLPLMVASRALARAPRSASEALGELRRAGRLGPLPGAAMRVERRLIRAGLDLPWGGSLLVVARRPDGSVQP
ncbi:MAG TPA: class I SAM-dependent methyltransferase, partial [Solirubrobacteraceae bacterium]|nr:class I SAM-dependent methyltransferase [Solirubrobacteraceae bacterium]